MNRRENPMNKKLTWWDYLPEDVQAGLSPLTEEDFWEAQACVRECDVSEISDRDPIEFL